MQRSEFLKLIGSKPDGADYIPVACLLRNGYACAGYVNQAVSEQFGEVCILVNARMVDLREPNRRTERGAIHDFSDFLEEFVVEMMERPPQEDELAAGEHHHTFESRFGKSIPLTAIAFDEMAVVYPVVRIGHLLQQAKVVEKEMSNNVPSFLDFERRSVVLKVLRARIW